MRKTDFIKIVERNYDKLARRCKLSADASDIVSTVVLNILEKKKYKSIKRSPLGWLSRAVAAKEIDIIRRRSFEQSLFVGLNDCVNYASATHSAVDLMASCRVAIGKLPSLQRYIVEHLYLGNETYASLSGLVGMPIKELKAEGAKAKESLRKALCEKGG